MAEKKLYRAGRKIQQPNGYSAFIPTPLPPSPSLEMNDEILDMLSKADRALGRLDGAIAMVPNPELFVFMYVRKEALLSSQIEGTQASLTDLLAFEAKSYERHREDVAEISNYINAMNYGLERLREFPLSLRLLREIQEKLLAGTRGCMQTPGEFRTSQNWIGPPGCTLKDAVHIPPPPAEMMDALGKWELFLHDETPMPILIKLGFLHAQFETIHPFLDGNGRVGRLLITFILCQREILQRPLLYLSIFFKRNRREYYDRLQAIRDTGDWEGWMLFFLRGVYEVAQEATDTARSIVKLRENDRQRILDESGGKAANALKTLEFLFRMPFVSVPQIAEAIHVSFASANTLTRTLQSAGILVEITRQKRNRMFLYQSYLNIFEEGTELEVQPDQP